MECKRIRHVVGTALGIKSAPDDLCRLDGVRVRLSDESETTFEASLVIGLCILLVSCCAIFDSVF